MSLHPKPDESDMSTHDDGNAYRMNKIREFENYLKSEIQSRYSLYKKYNRACMAVDGTCAGTSLAAVSVSAVGMVLVATGVAAIPGLALECVSAFFGMVDMVGIFVSRKIRQKMNKHHDIKTAAVSSLKSLTLIASKALNDGHVTDDEFNAIINLLDMYNELKEKIRLSEVDNESEDKKKLVREAKRLIKRELIDKFGDKDIGKD